MTHELTDERVQPCPFCGATEHIHAHEGSTFRWMLVECGECGAQGPEARVQTLGDGTPEEWAEQGRKDAFAEWNRRAALLAHLAQRGSEAPKQPQEPVAWLIAGTVGGVQRRVVFTHNAVGDYRDIWENVTSTPLYAAPPAEARQEQPKAGKLEAWQALYALDNLKRYLYDPSNNVYPGGALDVVRAFIAQADADSSYSAQPKGETATARDAALYRKLMALPGARRRIWNHVLDEETKGNHDSIEAALSSTPAQGDGEKECSFCYDGGCADEKGCGETDRATSGVDSSRADQPKGGA